MTLRSFAPGARAAVIGASGGIGGAMAALLAADPGVAETLLWSRSGRAPEGLTASPMDITEEASVAAAAEAAGTLDLVIVATGLLHDGAYQPEKDMRALGAEGLMRAFMVNAVGPALVAKHFLPRLRRDGRAVFAALSARVGSISDNRLGGWHGYRASKAALNMLIRNLAIETARRRPAHVLLSLQPGTVDTDLSRPFQGSAQTLLTPDASAGALLAVIDGATAAQSGDLLDWNGVRLPF